MDPATQIVVREGMTGLYDAFSRGDTIAAQDRMTAFIAEAEKSYFRSLESSMKAPGGAADRGRARRKSGDD